MATITYFGKEYTVPCDGYVDTDVDTGTTFFEPLHKPVRRVEIGVNTEAQAASFNRQRVLDILNAGETFPIEEKLWVCKLSSIAVIASDTEPTAEELRRHMGFGVIFREWERNAMGLKATIEPITSTDQIPEEFRSRVPLGNRVIADLTAYPSRDLTAQEIMERIIHDTGRNNRKEES